MRSVSKYISFTWEIELTLTNLEMFPLNPFIFSLSASRLLVDADPTQFLPKVAAYRLCSA